MKALYFLFTLDAFVIFSILLLIILIQTCVRISLINCFCPCSWLLACICSVSHSSACSHAQGRWGGILWFSKSKASPRVHIIDAAGGPARMPGHEAGWGREELADPWGAGQAELELQITLDIARCSVCNQDQTGSGWGRRKSLSISVKPACACVSPGWVGWHSWGRWWKCPTTSSSL